MPDRRTAGTHPEIDAVLVSRLVDTPFPRWAELPLELRDPAGSDHVIHRPEERRSACPTRCGRRGAAGVQRGAQELLPCLPDSGEAVYGVVDVPDDLRSETTPPFLSPSASTRPLNSRVRAARNH